MAMELDVAKLRTKYAGLLGEAKKLTAQVEGGNISKEVSEKINGLLGQADEVKLQMDMAERLRAGEQFASEGQGTKAAHNGWRPAGPDEGLPPVDIKSWREVEVKTGDGRVMDVRFHVPIATQGKDYPSAFEAYIRKGHSEMGPNDRKTLTEGIDSAGGFLVPPDYQEQLVKKQMTMAIIRPNALVVQTSRDQAQWPKVSYTTDDKYTSGVRLTWTGETPAKSTSHRVTDPVFGLYTVPVHTAMASMPVSNNLLEDGAFDVFGIGSELMAEAFALGEDDAFIQGNGVSRPMGILAGTLTTAGGENPAYVASSTTSTLTADGIIDLSYALPSQYEANAAWYMAKSTEKIIRQLKDSNNNYLWPVINSVGNFGAAMREILGYPIRRGDMMPAVAANAYPIIFGDMRGYLVLDRVGLSVQRLTEVYAELNQTVLLGRKRVGGQTVQPWRLKVQKVAAS